MIWLHQVLSIALLLCAFPIFAACEADVERTLADIEARISARLDERDRTVTRDLLQALCVRGRTIRSTTNVARDCDCVPDGNLPGATILEVEVDAPEGKRKPWYELDGKAEEKAGTKRLKRNY